MSFLTLFGHATTPPSELSRRMQKLAALEEEAGNEADGLKKAELLVKCRMEQNDLKKMAQNAEDLSSKVSQTKSSNCH